MASALTSAHAVTPESMTSIDESGVWLAYVARVYDIGERRSDRVWCGVDQFDTNVIAVCMCQTALEGSNIRIPT